ncbi:MAG: hypothetical protein QXF87_03070 [Thermofilaceae archaeon]
MGASQREAERVLEAKRRYWLKALSEDAIDSNFWRMFNVYDLACFYGDWTLSDTLWSSLIVSLLFDIPLSDVVPWLLNWELELPTTDEFLSGILISIEPIDITIEFPELGDVSLFNDSVLVPEVAEAVNETRLEKGRYGVSRYDESYYDPPAVREFFRSSLLAFTKKGYSVEEARHRVATAAEVLGIREDMARNVFNRLSMFSAIKAAAATWDYAWWDLSEWSVEGSSGRLTYVTWDLEEVEVEYETLFDPACGAIWDEALWDFSYWVPDVAPFILDLERMGPAFDRYRDRVVELWRRRIIYTPLVAANYQRLEERTRLTSPRTETYALPMGQVNRLKSIVDHVVAELEPGASPARVCLYERAVLELYGSLYGVHRWGDEMQRAMGRDELREWWLRKWEGDGLSAGTLMALWDRCIDVIDALGSARLRDRLNFMRTRIRRR